MRRSIKPDFTEDELKHFRKTINEMFPGEDRERDAFERQLEKPLMVGDHVEIDGISIIDGLDHPLLNPALRRFQASVYWLNNPRKGALPAGEAIELAALRWSCAIAGHPVLAMPRPLLKASDDILAAYYEMVGPEIEAAWRECLKAVPEYAVSRF